MRFRNLGLFVPLASLLVLMACKDDPVAPVVSDFSLTDVNFNSASHGQSLSPRKYVGTISAWYFGHAT